MCGIFAYVNHRVLRSTREILNVLLDGLQRVEYRGYDSAGLCVDSGDSRQPAAVIRSVGNIALLRERVYSEETAADVDFDASVPTHVGIAHTRWATHGTPSIANCHPQVSNNKKFMVVHNGIMSNFMPVKQMLEEKGYDFASETDTEVIAVLAEYFCAENPAISFPELAGKLMAEVGGAYAILMKSSHFPGELIACRRGSPLVVGIRTEEAHINNSNSNNTHITTTTTTTGDDVPLLSEVYFASDVNSFLPYTQKAIFLEDDDVAHYCEGVLTLYSTASGVSVFPVTRTVHTLEFAPEGLYKNGYEHFMLKEIYDQPESIMRSMHGRINFQSGQVQIDGIDTNTVASLRCMHRLMLIACGTSYHSCLAARPIFEELLPNVPVTVENAPDLVDRRPHIRRDDLCLFVSQSGETADTLMALQHCKDGGAVLIGLTNVAGSSVLRQTDYSVLLNAGMEVGVASTKAYTTQIVILVLLALLLSQGDGKNTSNTAAAAHCTNGVNASVQKRRAEIISGLASLPEAISRCLKTVKSDVMALAEEWLDACTLLILGRGYDYPTALESALKVKEVSYVHTEGIHAGELKHGPLALVDGNTNVVVFCPHGRHFELSKNAIQQVRARGGCVVAITTQTDAEVLGVTTRCVQVPTVVDCLQGVVNVVPLQLLAYHLAVGRGHNVDCPRNLAKSVTVQ